jgi:dTDP-4-amino-4,6-dideoxygalactose transaminase
MTQPAKKLIPFIDLQSQKTRLGLKIENAIQRVLDHGIYIMGPEITELEDQLSEMTGAKHAITCSNGTDALILILMAKEIGPNDAVLMPSFTFAATAEVVAFLGATPVFLDVLPGTYNLDPHSLEKGVAIAKSLGLNPVGLISVDLYGQPADYDPIEAICEKHGLWLLSDAAQSCGASYKGRKVGTIGMATSTSFYPAKPLGCYGDGGAIFTDDDALADIMRSIRVHGQGSDKYDNVRIGMNGRLDTLQAAILLEKLTIFKDETKERQKIADNYNSKFKDIVGIPILMDGVTSVWAQYTICVKKQYRETIIKELAAKGIPTAIHYPKPLHKQTAFKDYPTAGNLLVSEMLAESVLSLPMHPYLSIEIQEEIIQTVIELVTQKEKYFNVVN